MLAMGGQMRSALNPRAEDLSADRVAAASSCVSFGKVVRLDGNPFEINGFLAEVRRSAGDEAGGGPGLGCKKEECERHDGD